MVKVGITGGIGSGKTTVTQVLKTLGYPVYNADDRGRWLTNNNHAIIDPLKKLFGSDIYPGGKLDRAKVAGVVFNDKAMLDRLNRIIHPVVANDFLDWVAENRGNEFVFKEAAIMFESGAHKNLDKVICITAPQEVRIQRVANRDKIDKKQILARIKNQMSDKERIKLSDFVIHNDGKQFVTTQLFEILNSL